MKRPINTLLLVLLALTALCCNSTVKSSEPFKYSWERVLIDSTFDKISDKRATDVIMSYSSMIEPLQEIIGYSKGEYDKYRPESGLSNFAADVIRLTAEKEFGMPMDVGLTNFGGIRTSLPKGAVRVYDIYSIFPFDNTIAYVEIKGSELLRFFETMVSKGRIEALSNIELIVSDNEIEKLLVGGRTIDSEKIYKLATIDFLLEGGDGLRMSKFAQKVYNSNVYIRDAIISYIRQLTAEGTQIDLKSDKRVVIND